MNLTPEERVKFAQYLHQVSIDDDKLADECDKFEQGSMAIRLRNEAKAARIVADRLLSIEENDPR
jgi:hypothetical protein